MNKKHDENCECNCPEDHELEEHECNCDCQGECDHEEYDCDYETEMDIIYLTLDDDTELECVVLGIFEVDDYEAAHAKHAKMGCICYENPAMGIYFITDPDNYWLEIVPAKK